MSFSLHMLGAKVTPAVASPVVDDEDVVDIVEKNVKAVSARVSPWLWILSVTGFSFAILNRWQIQKMYGSHKNMKKALLP